MNHYFKDVQTLKSVDVYRVLVLFDVKSHPIGHAVKKLLCAGKRGAKDYRQDLIEAKASIERELAMMDEEEKMMCGEKWLETGNPFAEGDMGESQTEWLKAENARLTKQNEQLMKDVHRIDAARQAAVSQCSAMAERIDELERELAKQNRDLIDPKDVMIKLLQDTNNELQGKLDDITVIMLGGAVGERGHACMSVDGGNL